MNLCGLVMTMWILVRLDAPWWLYIFWGMALAGWIFGSKKGE